MNYVIQNENLIKEWDWEVNNKLGFYPDQLTLGSGKKVAWICALGHHWYATITNRSRGNNCPFCANRKILKGFNDLATTHPDLILEWNWDKNISLSPYEVSAGSNKKVWWIDCFGHEWEAVIASRALNKAQCPYCTGEKVLAGFNDLATTHPQLSAEWNYEKNGDLLPTQVSSGSGKKVWWICPEGHEWQAAIYSRVLGSNCYYCNKENRMSDREIKLFYYIQKYFPNSISSYNIKESSPMELDIFIPEHMTAIEYDGEHWHQDIERDKKKDQACQDNNIKLIRIREPNCPQYESNCTFIQLQNLSLSTLSDVIKSILRMLGVSKPSVDFQRDHEEIEDTVFYKKRNNNLAVLFPDVAKDWHPIKNGNLKPESVFPYSGRKAWWKCHVCGHEWFQTIGKRTVGQGCKQCTERQSRLVFCIELGQLFVNNHQINTQVNTYYSNIRECCLGLRPSAGKHPLTNEPLHWKYVYDQVRKDGVLIKGAITLGYTQEEDIKNFYI